MWTEGVAKAGASLGFVLLANAAFVAREAPASGPSVTLSPGVEISGDDPNSRHVESVIAVNPHDARNLVAASIVLAAETRVAVYSSHDGGRSWQRRTDNAGGVAAFKGLDPALTFDPDGISYLVALGEELADWRS